MSAPERREPQSKPTRDSRPPSIAPLLVLPRLSPTPFLFRHFIAFIPHHRDQSDYPAPATAPVHRIPFPSIYLDPSSTTSLQLHLQYPTSPLYSHCHYPTYFTPLCHPHRRTAALFYVFLAGKVWVHTEPIPRRTRRCYPLENSGGVVN